jgi:glutathione S-transferase
MAPFRGRRPAGGSATYMEDSVMKLYYLTGACSMAANIALREAGLNFELVKVDRKTRKAADGLDYNEVNPKGYVPALTLDNGETLTENSAILQYIADRNPAAKLAPPAGTMERYRLLEWLGFINSEIHKGFSPLFRAELADAVKEYARNILMTRLDYAERALGSTWCSAGARTSVSTSAGGRSSSGCTSASVPARTRSRLSNPKVW